MKNNFLFSLFLCFSSLAQAMEDPFLVHVQGLIATLKNLNNLEKNKDYQGLFLLAKHLVTIPEDSESESQFDNVCAILESAGKDPCIKTLGNSHYQELYAIANTKVQQTNSLLQKLRAQLTCYETMSDLKKRDQLYNAFSTHHRAENIKKRLEQFKTYVDSL